MALGIVIGIAGASIKTSGARLPSLLVSLYTTVVRSIPELLIIYLLFFGSVQAISDLADALNWQEAMTNWFPALVGIVAIGLIAGSYGVEVFRDRKSVVLGKSVSVRVDLGGRRIIKKKNKHKN